LSVAATFAANQSHEKANMERSQNFGILQNVLETVFQNDLRNSASPYLIITASDKKHVQSAIEIGGGGLCLLAP
jgi:hypothetical protein